MRENGCKVTDKILTPFPGLDQAVDGDYVSRRKGVTWLEMVNKETRRTQRTGVVLRSGNWHKNGVVMNYCPFCGNPIGEHFHDKGETTT